MRTVNDPRRTRRVPALDALLLFFLANLVLQPLVDPDFGWHLRAGLDLVNNGWRMPAADPYSHTMPDWPWVEHAWLTDGLIGLLYSGLGSAGGLAVIVLFAAVMASAFLIAAAPAQAPRTATLLAIGAAAWTALPFLGARMQMMTLLGVAVVLWLFDRYAAGRLSNLWAIPPLFLLWANLHGGFTAGLFILSLVLAASTAIRVVLQQWPALAPRMDERVLTWSHIRHLGLMLSLAVSVTLINPYGWHLYAEIYYSLTDRFMIETLHEWQRVTPESRAGMMYFGYLAVLGVLTAGLYRKVEPVRWTVLLLFLGLSLLHWRNVLFFLIVSLPLSAEMLAAFWSRLRHVFDVGRHQPRWLFAATVFAALVVAWPGPEHLESVVQSGLAPVEFFRTSEYPMEAVQWILTHREEMGTRLYNDYGIGGFILWWLPAEKIFIDGRMPAWRVGTRWIFKDYIALTAWEPPELAVLDKYDVDWAIVGLATPLDTALNGRKEWRKIYRDEKVSIYAKASPGVGLRSVYREVVTAVAIPAPDREEISKHQRPVPHHLYF